MSNSNPTAHWDIDLYTNCPMCEHWFDLLDIDDIWHMGFEPIEHGTENTRNFEVTCPECDHDFKVDFEY